jgi:hypothetical protein
MTPPDDLPDAEADSRAADSAECFFVLASYRDSADHLARAVTAVANRAHMSPLLNDFFQFRHVELGQLPNGPAPELGAINRIAQELTSPVGDARHHYFAVVVLDRSASVVDAVLRGCQAHPALSPLPARWRGLAGTDDRASGGHGNEPSPAVQIALAPAGSWKTEALVSELWGYANHLLNDFASGGEESLSSQRLSRLHVLADQVAEELNIGRDGDGGRPSPGPRPAGSKPAGPAPAGYPPPLVAPPGQGTLQGYAPRPSSERSPSFFRRAWRAVASFFGYLVRALRGGAGSQPRLAAVDGVVRLVLVVVVGDGGRADPAEDWRGWSLLARVERKLARADAGFWVRPLSGPGRSGDLLHPAGRRARASAPRAADGPEPGLAGALEAARVVLDEDISALQGGSWQVDRPAVVLYLNRVPLSDPRTVRAYGDLLTALDPIVTWVVPPGSAELIAPQLRTGAIITTERRGAAVEVARLLCDKLAATRPS